MKAKLLALVSLASLFFLNGCNGIGDKDTLLARIDKEKVYQEDYTLLMKNGGTYKMSKGQYLYQNLYSKAALTARALSEYPELADEWKDHYADLESRVLTMVYQRYYVMECLMYSDAELRQYYDANRSLFPSDSTGDFYMVRGDVASYYYASKNQEQFDAYIKDSLKLNDPSAEELQKQKQVFANMRRHQLREELTRQILDKTHVGIQEVPAADAKTYYAAHKDDFMTTPGYELYHIQGSDSVALVNAVAENASLEQFKAAAAKYSANGKTAKDSGYVGHVKKNFALPYGIGMVEGLAPALEGKEPGFVTPVLRAADMKTFHRFYLAALDPAKLKPFDRVESSILGGIKDGRFFDVDSSTVLITKSGLPIFTEADLLRFNEKYFHRVITRPIHEKMVAMIAENLAFSEAAKEAHLNHTWEYRALYRSARWDFLSEKYIDKKLVDSSIPEDTLKAWYDRVGSPIYQNYSYERAKDDLRKVASFPENMYKHEYYMCYRMIYAGKTFEQSIPMIYARHIDEFKDLKTERFAAEAYTGADVYLYDTNVLEYKPYMILDSLLARADAFYKAGKRSEAYYAYRRVMYAYAENDSLFEKVAYDMAQIQGENEEFMDAEGEYYAFYTMWPNSVNAEKAMFSRGFMLNENLGWNDKALKVLEEFLQKYPNSELKESAQWLVDNIKSDGKLADDLMKKIEAEE